MAIFDLFSKRQKALRGEVPDVYTYDEIPHRLKVQIVQILREAFGKAEYTNDQPSQAYTFIKETLCKEYGTFSLNNRREDDVSQVVNFFLETQEVDKLLDVIELAFKYLIAIIAPNYQHKYRYEVPNTVAPEEAISELNIRFKESGIGYSFDGGEIIRVDSTYTHSEITKPVIALLWNSKFAGANEEYMKAHEHYRHGRNKECLTDCLKAFESTMKIICKEKNWAFNPTDTASKLIQACLTNGLIPTFTQGQFTSLQSLLSSGIPTIRNKVGGHGQGQVPQKVDDEMTRYGLNLTGSNIIFLIELSGL